MFPGDRIEHLLRTMPAVLDVPTCVPFEAIAPHLWTLAQSFSLMLGVFVGVLVLLLWPRRKLVEQVIIKDAAGDILAIHHAKYGASLRAWKRAQRHVVSRTPPATA